MFLSNRAKYFLTFTFFLISSASCGWIRTVSDNKPSSISGTGSELPFSTKEPEKYVAEFVITSGEIQRVNRVVRDGSRRRYDFDLGQSDQLTVLLGPRNVRMLPNKKIYIEDVKSGGPDGSAGDPITGSLLYQKQFAKFEELGTENNVTRYSCTFEGTDASKAVIYVDKSIGFPVRQEYYSIVNGVEMLSYSIEVRGFQTEIDAGLFEVPAGYRLVSSGEFQTSLSRS